MVYTKLCSTTYHSAMGKRTLDKAFMADNMSMPAFAHATRSAQDTKRFKVDLDAFPRELPIAKGFYQWLRKKP